MIRVTCNSHTGHPEEKDLLLVKVPRLLQNVCEAIMLEK